MVHTMLKGQQYKHKDMDARDNVMLKHS
jgi:hypothetical protein